MEDSKISGVNNQKNGIAFYQDGEDWETDCNKGGMSGVKIMMSVLDILSFSCQEGCWIDTIGLEFTEVWLKIQIGIISVQILFKVTSLRYLA